MNSGERCLGTRVILEAEVDHRVQALAWSELFQSAGTLGNYIGHVRLGCQLLEVSCEALTDPMVGRAKASIAKRRAFTPRKPLFLGQSRVRDILALSRMETSSQLLFHASMLFLTAYVFLLRLPSEALPIVRVGVGVSPDGKQASVSCDGDSLVLVLDRRKNRLHGSTLVRKCWCTQCSHLSGACPWALLREFPAGQTSVCRHLRGLCFEYFEDSVDDVAGP